MFKCGFKKWLKNRALLPVICNVKMFAESVSAGKTLPNHYQRVTFLVNWATILQRPVFKVFFIKILCTFAASKKDRWLL